MKKLLIILILLPSSIFSSDEPPVVTVVGNNGIWLTGTIKEYNNEKLIVNTSSGKIGKNITIASGDTWLSVKDIIFIDYGIKTIYENETDSTKKADLLNLLNQILPKGI